MNDRIKIPLEALALVLLSMICVCLISFSNQITNPRSFAAAAVFIATVAIGSVAVVITFADHNDSSISEILLIVAAVIAVCLLIIFYFDIPAAAVTIPSAASALAGFSAVVIFWDKKKGRQEIPLLPTILLILLFVLPLLFVFPLSKYHNHNQLERDMRIAGILQATALEDGGVEIILPSNHTSENSYLKNVLHLGWEDGLIKKREVLTSWKNAAIPCKEGKECWHKVNLAPPEFAAAKFLLVFRHAWKNSEARISSWKKEE